MQSFWLTRPFWALALGLFLNAYSYGVAAVALTWIPPGPWTRTLLLVWAPVGLSAGIAVGGILADQLGRQTMLRWGPLGYLVGGASLLAGNGLGPALLGSGVLILTAGVESNTILTYSQELIPLRIKRQTMYAELNFVNMGGLALAALAFVSHQWGPHLLRPGMTVLPMGLAILSFGLRRPLPESQLWAKSLAHPETFRLPADLRLRLLVAAGFSFANTAGFSLLTYAFGAEFLPRHFHHLLLVSTATAFAVGLSARWLGRLTPNTILLGGYGTALAAAIALAVVQTPGHSSFWPILFVLSAFTSMSYLAEDTFKTDAWPSRIRSRMIGLVRVAGLISYAILLSLVHGAPVHIFLRIVAGVWALGFLSALVWWLARRQERTEDRRPVSPHPLKRRRRQKIR